MPIFTFLLRVCKNSSSCWSIFCKWSENIFRCVPTEACSLVSYPTVLDNDTLCNIKTHVRIWERGEKQIFTDASWLAAHSSLSPQNLLLRNTIENSPCRLSVRLYQCNTNNPPITQHSHLSGWCQGPVHVEQAEDVPIWREAVQFFHVSVYFLWVCPLAKDVAEWNRSLKTLTVKPARRNRPNPSVVLETDSRLRVVRVLFPANQSRRKHTYVIKRGGWRRKGLKIRFCLKIYSNLSI